MWEKEDFDVLKIAVCDDDREHLKMIEKEAGKALFARTEYSFTSYQDGAEVVRAVEEGRFDCDLLLLDIHMKEMEGMETAAYLRMHEVDVDIIFVTVSQSHVFEGYTYKAFAYLLKPLSVEILRRELNRYLDEKEKCSEFLNISIRGKSYRLPLDKILYFESVVRKIIIHSWDGSTVEYYGKMNDLEQMLSQKGFIRCHQSYMVNDRFVSSVTRTEIRIHNATLPVSRKYWDVMKRINPEL